MAQKLRMLNPEGRFIVLSWKALSVKNLDPEVMTCPEDFFYDPIQRMIRRPDTLIGHFMVSDENDL